MPGRGWSRNPPHPETQNDINKFTSVVDDGGLNPTAFSVDNYNVIHWTKLPFALVLCQHKQIYPDKSRSISINLKICGKIVKYPKNIWIYLKTSKNIWTNLKKCKIMHKSLDSDWHIQSDIDNALNFNVIKFKIIQQNSKKSENVSLAFMNLNSDL